MIDISSERVVSLTEAPKHLPRRRKGKRPHVATIYRWAQGGCKGITLETIQIGGTKCTSLEALQRFFMALTDAASARPTESLARRQAAAAAAAERQLQQQGL